MKKGSGMRQLLAVLLAVWMAAAGALGAAAQEEKKQVAMSFTARSALLMEQRTGKVLFSQNETQRVAPASLTKLMDLLLDYGFAGFTLYQPQLPQDRLHPVAVKQGMQTQVEPQVEALPQAVVRKNEVDGIEIKLELSEQLQAPVAKGQAIGWIQLVQNGSIIAQQPVTAGQEVQQLTYAKSLRLLAKGLIGMNGQSVCEQVE